MTTHAPQKNGPGIARPYRPSSPSRPSRNHNEGVALFFVLMAIAVLAAVTSAFTAGVHRHLKTQHLRENQAAARYLAQAGLEIAAAKLADPSAGYQGETNTPLGTGQFSVELTPIDDTTTKFRSTGVILADSHSIATATLEATLRRDGTHWLSIDRRLANGRRGVPHHE